MAGTHARTLRDAVEPLLEIYKLVVTKIPKGIFDPAAEFSVEEEVPNRLNEGAMFTRQEELADVNFDK